MPLLAQLAADIPTGGGIKRDTEFSSLLSELRSEYGEDVVAERTGVICLYIEGNVACDGGDDLERFMKYVCRLSALAGKHKLKL